MRKTGMFILILCLAIPWRPALSAQSQDAAGSADPPQLARYPGSRIDHYEIFDFDSFSPRTLPLEGKTTRIRYAVPASRSVNEVHEHYSRTARKAGFEVLHQCEDGKCGGLDDCVRLPDAPRSHRRMIAKLSGIGRSMHLCLQTWSGGNPSRTWVEVVLVTDPPQTGSGLKPDQALAAARTARPPDPGHRWSLNPTRPVDECDFRKSVCIKTVPLENMEGIELWARTRLPGDITLTVRARMDNLESSVPFPVTTVIRSGDDKRLATLTPARFGSPWRHYFDWSFRYGRRGAEPDPTVSYALPFAKGQRGRVKSGYSGGSVHLPDDWNAFDFLVSTNTIITAARSGKILDIPLNSQGTQNEGMGTSIMVAHEDGTVAQYFSALLDAKETYVGADVKVGAPLARFSKGYRASEADLHFGVYVPVDGASRRSVPIRFDVGPGPAQVLQEGRIYERP